MEKFEFSLQKILDLKTFQRKQAEIELGKANQEVSRIQAELENIASQIVSSRASVSQSSDFRAIVAASQYFNFLEVKKEKLLEELAQANLVAEEKRSVFIENLQRQTALEKLKEKKLEKWKEEAKKEEQKVIDDVIIAKYNK